MKVEILIAGNYMNKELKAVKCQKGAILETQGWYGSEMIANKQAKKHFDTPEEEAAEKKRKAAERRRATAMRKKAEQAKKAAQAAKTGNPGEAFMQ